MKRLAFFITISLILTTICSNTVYAQVRSERLKPKWVTHTLPEPETDSYFFVSAYAVGTSLEAARQAAFFNLSKRLEDEHGMLVNTHFKQTTHNTVTTNSITGSRVSEMVVTAEENGREINIGCRVIDEWWKRNNGRYEIHVLYAVSRGSVGGTYTDDIVVTAKYPAAGFLSIIPSVGQFYKGSTVKGSLILAGEVAAATSIILCESTRASYIKKMYEQPQYAQQYSSLADNWETGRNISIGAAAAIYVYNLIDGFVAKGAKRVVVNKHKVKYNVAPYTDGYSAGVAMSLTF